MFTICLECNLDMSSHVLCLYVFVTSVRVQEIYQDRKKFSEHVFKVASSDLVNMGIGVVSYTLKDVHDDQVLYLCRGSFSANAYNTNLMINNHHTKHKLLQQQESKESL